MKFSAREDVNAPVEAVFAALTRFENHERAAMRRGIEVRRRGEPTAEGVGTVWDLRFTLRGKGRELALEVVRFDPPYDLVVGLRSRNVTGAVTCELFALSRTRTRLTFAAEVRPLTLPARLLIQSLRLTKPKLDRKFKERVAEFAVELARAQGRQA